MTVLGRYASTPLSSPAMKSPATYSSSRSYASTPSSFRLLSLCPPLLAVFSNSSSFPSLSVLPRKPTPHFCPVIDYLSSLLANQIIKGYSSACSCLRPLAQEPVSCGTPFSRTYPQLVTLICDLRCPGVPKSTFNLPPFRAYPEPQGLSLCSPGSHWGLQES
jgi:hypothetical protein